ncbi:MAG TPA: metal ABC transporter permease [Pseudomonadales bacterium]|nr:metal ABC transporter permease [Pseudomonadales bacterium]
MNISFEDLGIIIPAFLAGVLVLVTHVPLGMRILGRGIVFIDLAIAQIAALGVIVAGIFELDPQGWATQCAAATAALLGASLLAWTEKRWPDVQEAQIGVIFVLAATGGILLLANNPHGGEHLRDLLAGQILWVRYSQLLIPLIGTFLIAGILLTRRDNIGPLLFYFMFALAVTASVQLVGVYLVFASLIIPALATRKYQGKARMLAGYGTGTAGYAIGLVLSTIFDLPSGAIVVWCMALVAVCVYATKRVPECTTSPNYH